MTSSKTWSTALLRRWTRTQFDEVAGEVKSYMSGGDYMDSDEIQSHLNRIVRMLI